MPAGVGVQSGSAGLTGTYVPGTGQVNTGYSVGPGSTGYEAVSRLSDDVEDSNLASHFRLLHVTYFVENFIPLFGVVCVIVILMFQCSSLNSPQSS